MDINNNVLDMFNDDNKPTILVVDDVDMELALLEQMLDALGFKSVLAMSVDEAIKEIEKKIPNLILLDLIMPDVDGFQFMEILNNNPETRDIPVIIVSAMDASYDKRRAFNLGAVDFIGKPFDFSEVALRVNIHLKIFTLQHQLEEKNQRLAKVVKQQARAIENEQKRLLQTLAAVAEKHSFGEHPSHLKNCAHNVRLLAQGLNFTDKYENQLSDIFIDALEVAANIHDIGKISVPSSILSKPGPLTETETEICRSHTTQGFDLISEIYPGQEENPYIKTSLEVIKYHHERWNGSGYPDGLKEENIPLSARIMKIIDSYDTLIHDRTYRKAVSKEEAIKILQEGSGFKYDPYIMKVFCQIVKQLTTD
ncbi:putative two-component system response regulator [Acetitomaculum ruminis DSM 5522]|uniref:Stage 0 sporulation protein A homolog n=1 Tax=Acetitomaculum ruminis DSM 5522 TaxID=1120918 RepID=A0A1I0WD43_9FIRM|nr:HD domain-containing phosphohydrolase [Acetitomaculum ruminis]SFA86561.1 putative two-component system response regulator [Acetitomaculum ruminis DSM 5522]